LFSENIRSYSPKIKTALPELNSEIIENKKDLEDVPKEVIKDLKFVFVSHMDEVLPIAFTKSLERKETPHARIMPRPQLQLPKAD